MAIPCASGGVSDREMPILLLDANQDRLVTARDMLGFPDGGGDGRVPVRRNAHQAPVFAVDFEAVSGGAESDLQDRITMAWCPMGC